MTNIFRTGGLAFGLALAVAGGLAADPALAQRKSSKGGEAAKAKYSKSFLTAIGIATKAGEKSAIETEIAAQQWDAALARLAQAEAAPDLTADDRLQISRFKALIGQSKNDMGLLRTGLEGLVASPSTSAEDKVKFQRNIAAIYVQQNDYAGAAKAFEGLVAANPNDPLAAADLARIYYRLKQPQQALAAIDKAEAAYKASGQPVPEEILGTRFQLAYDSKMGPQTQSAARALVRAYPSAKNWENAILALRQGVRMDEQLDLDAYRLQHATGSLIGQAQYLDYVNTAFQRGLPGEARRVLTEGQQKGVIPAGNATARELAGLLPAATVAKDRASLPSLEKEARASKNFKLARAAADGYLSQQDYAKAIEMYELALTKGDNAETINTRIGIANAYAGNTAAAKAAFAKVQSGPRGDLARWWEVYLDSKGGAAAATSA